MLALSVVAILSMSMQKSGALSKNLQPLIINVIDEYITKSEKGKLVLRFKVSFNNKVDIVDIVDVSLM